MLHLLAAKQELPGDEHQHTTDGNHKSATDGGIDDLDKVTAKSEHDNLSTLGNITNVNIE